MFSAASAGCRFSASGSRQVIRPITNGPTEKTTVRACPRSARVRGTRVLLVQPGQR